MALPKGIEEIGTKLVEELTSTKFACQSVIPLSGGTANFIFKGHLIAPLEDGTTDVLIKHGEGFVALNPDFKISTSRCKFEETCIETLQRLPPTSTSVCEVRTPKLYLAISESNTQLQEYLKGALNLKLYSLQHYASPTSETLKAQCVGIGNGLGQWLRRFHHWGEQPEQTIFRSEIKQNEEMQALKHMINYEWLIRNIEKHSQLLEAAGTVFEQVRDMAKAELADEDNLKIIHGDFWTGNALLPNEPILGDVPIPIFIIDWEMCQLGVHPLDLGQMIAELYELSLFKDIQAGVWMVEGFAKGYHLPNDAFAFRTAIHVGIHLINFGSTVPGWGTPEQVEEVIKTGRDIIVQAWEKDKEWFANTALGCLFTS